MPVAVLSTKGQVTLPAAFRRELGMKPHDRIIIEKIDGAIVIRPAPDFFELEGSFGKALPPDEEREAMAWGVARHVLGEDL